MFFRRLLAATEPIARPTRRAATRRCPPPAEEYRISRNLLAPLVPISNFVTPIKRLPISRLIKSKPSSGRVVSRGQRNLWRAGCMFTECGKYPASCPSIRRQGLDNGQAEFRQVVGTAAGDQVAVYDHHAVLPQSARVHRAIFQADPARHPASFDDAGGNQQRTRREITI